MTTDGELWHVVEAKRDDGMPTMFNIRELEPRKQLTKIFVVELPYPKTTPACLPSAADYRRHAELEEQWLRPACSTLGWELVGSKVEDGSFFFYMYGAGDPNGMIEKLLPYDAGLGFYDDDDPDWQEYGTLRDLLDQAKAMPAPTNGEPPAAPKSPSIARAKTVALIAPEPTATHEKARTSVSSSTAITNEKAKARPKAKAKPATAKASNARAKPASSKAKAKAKPAKAANAKKPAKAKAKKPAKAKAKKPAKAAKAEPPNRKRR